MTAGWKASGATSGAPHEVGVGVRLGLRLRRDGEVVPHSHELEVLHSLAHDQVLVRKVVEVDVRRLGQLDLDQLLVERGLRHLEALVDGGDAAVRPVRQQQERGKRSEPRERGAIRLGEGAPATVLAPDAVHRGHQGVVLVPTRASLVAAEGEVHGEADLAAVDGVDGEPARHRAQRQADEQDDERESGDRQDRGDRGADVARRRVPRPHDLQNAGGVLDRNLTVLYPVLQSLSRG